MAGRWDTEDWSLALAEQGAADAPMEDINSGAPGEFKFVRSPNLRRENGKIFFY